MTKRNIRVSVYSQDNCWSIPSALDEFMAFWKEHFDKVPMEFRESTSVDIEAQGEYGGCATLSVDISYQRPETDKEYEDRLSQERAITDIRQAREDAQFERLKAKIEARKNG